MKSYESVILVGMMGSGKTSIAKKLAKKLAIPHIDTDHEIKKNTQFSVKELVEQNQLEKLNEIEFEIIKSNMHKKCIISTGDYTVQNEQSWDFIITHSLTVWINIHLNKIFERLKPTENRPFFSDDFEKVKQIFYERKTKYSQAKIQIKNINSHKIEELIKIINYFSQKTIVL